MPGRVPARTGRSSLAEIRELHGVVTDKLLATLARLATDERALEAASKDPVAYLRRRGITMPEGLEIKFPKLPAKKRCYRVCRFLTDPKPMWYCIEICLDLPKLGPRPGPPPPFRRMAPRGK
ncbi:MAG: hypothetical protein WEC75_13550 [Dehalococcoidia bacterium]